MRKIFEFGKNWQEYSNRFLNYEKISEATKSLKRTFNKDGLSGKTFLDIGCGSGIFSIAAANLGTEKIVGFDVDPICIETAKQNKKRFLKHKNKEEIVKFIQKSALDPNIIKELGLFDIVYAWGSLHHTGNMYGALDIVSMLVKKGGIFCVAIYNKDITSPVWLFIKKFYNNVPRLIKILMQFTFTFIIYIAKLIYTQKNPIRKNRGMSFFYDVVDWLGGYPYEFASKDEIITYVKRKNFILERFFAPEVPTGCNTFVFKKSF